MAAGNTREIARGKGEQREGRGREKPGERDEEGEGGKGERYHRGRLWCTAGNGVRQ